MLTPLANNAEMTAYFMELHGKHLSGRPMLNTAERWNGFAGSWERGGDALLGGHAARARAEAEFLRRRGLLGGDCDVADIGCGPGRFACEFARTARSVVGFDISPRMAELGASTAAEEGLDNVSFSACDFRALDIAAEGLEQRFDLVFSSMTPAVRGLDGLERLMSLSRGFCCEVTHVSGSNELQSRMMRELFGRERPEPRYGNGQWFYSLFNLLFLLGYYPEASYCTLRDSRRIPAGEEYARHCVHLLLPEAERTEENVRLASAWLERNAQPDGTVTEESETCYGRVLWDVRVRGERPEYGAPSGGAK